MAYSFNPFTGNLDLVDQAGAIAQEQIDALIELSGVASESTDLGTFTGTTIPNDSNNKEAFQALETGLENHISDSVDAHAASAITNTPAGTISAITVQAAITELDGDIQSHINDAADAHAATAITNTPSGNLVATDVQGALNEIQTELDGVSSDVADLVTLSGVAANATDLGTFTGSIIPDNSDNKEAFQALETFVLSIPSPFYYGGTWLASTNTPTLSDSDVGQNGKVYYVNDSGTVDFGAGPQVFNAGDKVANNGTIWDKWDMTDAVGSVFGRTGAVTSSNGDYTASQVTNVPAGTIAAVTVQDAITELDSDVTAVSNALTDHIDDIVDAHDASSISVDNLSFSVLTATDAQGTFSEIDAFLTTITPGSTADLPPTQAIILNNQASPVDVTGFVFSATTVVGFNAIATLQVFDSGGFCTIAETFILTGNRRHNTVSMAVESVGDNSGFVLSIVDIGGGVSKIQYTSPTFPDYDIATLVFRATAIPYLV
jgi:hypothetical protein